MIVKPQHKSGAVLPLVYFSAFKFELLCTICCNIDS